MKDWRRVPDWGDDLPPQKGGGDGGWGQSPVSSSRLYSSKHGKPPPSPGSWQPTVPSWEKRFCTAVCRIPWRKICETKRLMSYYSNVIDWDDSAGKEAFDNAKARFFSEINGLPCDIPLPGSDIYIDEINWESDIDPQLLLELEKELLPADVDAKDVKIGFLSSGWDRAIPCTGWGDAEDVSNPVRDAQAGSVLANYSENCGNIKGWDHSKDGGDGAADNSAWGARAQQDNSGWGATTREDNSGWRPGAWENNTGWEAGKCEDSSGWAAEGWEDNFRWRGGVWEKSLDDKRHNNSWWQQDNNRNNQTGYWESKRHARKREGDGLYGSRSPAFRHPRDDFHQPTNYWRNSRGRKRTNYQNELPPVNEALVPRQQNAMRSCGLRN